MNELDGRLSAWNPVRTADVPGTAASAEAADLLQHILSQPVTSLSQRQSALPRRPAKAWIAAAAAVVVAAAGIGVSESLLGRTNAHTASSGPPVIGFQYGPSQGLATNAVELVDYATRAAALTPVVVPGPHEWMYRDQRQINPNFGPRGYHEVTWFEVGGGRIAILDHGKLSYSDGPHGGQLVGWPGTWNNLYRYLGTLPAQPAALRRLLLANNHSSPAAAFRAIQALMQDFALPARFQAELYAVLTSLPGVRFDRSAADFAGRHGIGLYMIQQGFVKMEIIINPRTYTYMGVLQVIVKTTFKYGQHLHKGTIWAWNAILSSGIVKRAGQLP